MALKPIPYTADGSGPKGAIPVDLHGVDPDIQDIEGLEARLNAIENRLDGLEN